jgi:hypothetical protein
MKSRRWKTTRTSTMTTFFCSHFDDAIVISLCVPRSEISNSSASFVWLKSSSCLEKLEVCYLDDFKRATDMAIAVRARNVLSAVSENTICLFLLALSCTDYWFSLPTTPESISWLYTVPAAWWSMLIG